MDSLKTILNTKLQNKMPICCSVFGPCCIRNSHVSVIWYPPNKSLYSLDTDYFVRAITDPATNIFVHGSSLSSSATDGSIAAVVVAAARGVQCNVFVMRNIYTLRWVIATANNNGKNCCQLRFWLWPGNWDFNVCSKLALIQLISICLFNTKYKPRVVFDFH